MKIKQFSFTIDYPSASQKNKANTINKLTSQIIHSNRSVVCSPNLKNNSIKRLKYYSTKNKQAIPKIDENNIQIFEQQFKKFQDANIKNGIKINASPKKNVLNLIVKKYYRSNKINTNRSQVKKQENKNKTINSDRFIPTARKKNRQKTLSGFDDKFCRSYLKQDNPKDIMNEKQRQRKNNKIDVQNSNQICEIKNHSKVQNYQKIKCSQKENSSAFQQQQGSIQNQVGIVKKFQHLQQKDKNTQLQVQNYQFVQKYHKSNKKDNLFLPQEIEINNCFGSSINQIFKRKNNQKKRVLVKQQRLKMHIFNKSTFTKFQNADKNSFSLLNNINQMHFQDKQQNLQFSCPIYNQQKLPINPETVRTSKISKRYISIDPKTPSSTLNIQIPVINPYTNRQYLHIKNQVQNQKIRTIQKIIKTSYSTNMIKSFHVKSFSVEKQQNQKQFALPHKINQNHKFNKDQFFTRKFKYSPSNKIFRRNNQQSNKNITKYEKDPNGINAWEDQNQSNFRYGQDYQNIL